MSLGLSKKKKKKKMGGGITLLDRRNHGNVFGPFSKKRGPQLCDNLTT